MRALLAILLVVVTMVGPGPGPRALADDAAESRFFDRVGRAAFAARRYERALASFLRAQRAAPSPRGLYNVAICARLAHHDVLAFASFEELLARTDLAPALRAEAVAQRDELARTLALVHIDSDPPGATIYVDRRDLGSYGTTPATLALPTGAHQIELVRVDHEDAAVSVEATVGARREVHSSLTPQVGRVRVDTVPPLATVVAQRDGRETPLVTGEPVTLPVGTYTLVATAAGFQPASATIHVLPNADVSRAIGLTPMPTPRGRVLLTTGQVRARVRVDDVEVAETPARIDGVIVGRHRVTVSAEGYREWSQEIDVTEGRTTFLSITLVQSSR